MTNTSRVPRMYPVADLADLPSFCKPMIAPHDSSMAYWIDGWSIEPTGDHETDWKTGEAFADIAVNYARAKKDPHWISFFLASIHFKAGIPASVEGGFFARIAKLAYAGSLN